MACCRHSETRHVVWTLPDRGECKSRRIIVVARKETCIGHRSVDLENKPVIGAQASRMIKVVECPGSITLEDTEPTSDQAAGRFGLREIACSSSDTPLPMS